jgi:hypothetical protein
MFPNKKDFFKFVNSYNRNYRPDSQSMANYIKLINAYRNAKNLDILFKSNSYIDLVYDTLGHLTIFWAREVGRVVNYWQSHPAQE